MKKLSLFLCSIMALLLVQCNSDDYPLVPDGEIPIVWAANQVAVVNAENNFGFKLLKDLNDEAPADNIFISPFSVSMAMSMTLNGANGETENAIKSGLEMNDLDMDQINQGYKGLLDRLPTLDEAVALNIANSIWYDPNRVAVEEPFLALCDDYYYSQTAPLAFQDPVSVNIINDWIEEATNGNITDMLDAIPGEAIMYLVNAIHFQANWQTAFNPENTLENHPFYLEDGTTATCQLMRRQDEMMYQANDLFQAVDIPYGDAIYSMTILLPNWGHTTQDIINEMDTENWATWMNNFTLHPEVWLNLPRFTMEYKKNLADILRAMDMEIAFSSGADFSDLGSSLIGGNPHIGRVIHQSFVEVNEEGTEASAATIVEIIAESSAGPPIFEANRPFVFVIRENVSNTILFTGKVMNPEE